MGKVTKVEFENKISDSDTLTARIKKKGKKRFGKVIILKGKGAKKDENK